MSLREQHETIRQGEIRIDCSDQYTRQNPFSLKKKVSRDLIQSGGHLYILVAQEYILVAQEYIRVAQEYILAAQEYILAAQ